MSDSVFKKYAGIEETRHVSLNILGEAIKSIPLLIYGTLMKCYMWSICESMWSPFE